MTSGGTYLGDALRAVAMPLGGIGTGTISLAGDGGLRQWEIHNQVNHQACVPHSFFGVYVRQDHPVRQVARVLQSSALYDAPGPAAPPTSTDHVVPEAHRDLLRRLPGVEATQFIGRYPIAEVSYFDRDLPIQVCLEAFNPFVPLDADESGLPVIVFGFTLTNVTDRRVRASVLATLQNTVGWDGVASIAQTACTLFGGNVNTVSHPGGMTAIAMTSTRLAPHDPSYGSMVLAALSADATYLAEWDTLESLWADFSSDGALACSASGAPSDAGRTWNAALAQTVWLEPGRSQTATFLLAWHFPNRVINWGQPGSPGTEGPVRYRLGNRYAIRFGSALDVAAYVAANLKRLSRLTHLAHRTLYDATLPFSLIDAAIGQVSVLRSPTCFWTEDGRFYGFEGCCGASTAWARNVGGCCPLNCTHVWNYEMAVARLYPSLERSMREVEWQYQQAPEGYLPHRVVLPLDLPRPWGIRIGGPDKPALDGLLGAILKTYREYRTCGDTAWLLRHWPNVRRAIEYVWRELDPQQSGVIEGEQPNTYDVSIWGANTFIGTLYLAALLASEKMAHLAGEPDFAALCRAAYEHGRVELDRRLFNGEYYIQDVRLEEHPEQAWATGCHSDQLLGQWWAHLLGLGHLMDAAHVGSAAEAIARHNFRQHFRGFRQSPRQLCTEDDQGLLVCTWPRGGRPSVPTQYCDEVWTGIEYAVAALLLWEGRPREAIRIVEAARRRYDGRKQNPWNDIECGDHYVRAMSAWSMLEAAAGFTYDAAAAEVGFAPALEPDRFKAPFVARDGWGSFSQQASDRRQQAAVTLAYGTLELKALVLKPLVKVEAASATVKGQPVAIEWTETEGLCRITFAGAGVVVREGQTLTVTLGSPAD